MLVTQQPVLRRFWYALMPLSMLDSGPQPFTLLGERLVRWGMLPDHGHATADRSSIADLALRANHFAALS